MADGYGFGGEGDWKTSALVRIVKVMSQGLEGGVSFMEDYTYDFGAGSPACLGAHMLEVCPTISGGQAAPARSIRSSWASARIPCASCSPARPGPRVVVGMVDMGTRLRLVANEIDAVDAARGLAEAAGGTGAVEAPPGPHHCGGVAGCSPVARTTPAIRRRVGLDTLEDFAEMVGVELVAIEARTDADQFRRELQWSNAHWHLAGPV